MGILTINTENSKVGISLWQNVFEVDKTEMKHVSPTAVEEPSSTQSTKSTLWTWSSKFYKQKQ